MIVTEDANLDMALRAVVFAAVGTTGQRCTTLRRLFVHESIVDDFVSSLVAVYRDLPIGHPWEDGVLVGPLINAGARERMLSALDEARAQGGDVLCGGTALARPGYFVTPAIVRASPDMPIVAEETFAPILYVMSYEALDDAIAANNAVAQGLSSAIFTERLGDAEQFLSAAGSDCGIANVNLGTSGRRSAARSAARKTRAAAAKPAATHGKPTCAARRARSTTATSCRSPKACASMSRRAAAASWRQRMRTFFLATLC